MSLCFFVDHQVFVSDDRKPNEGQTYQSYPKLERVVVESLCHDRSEHSQKDRWGQSLEAPIALHA